MDDAPQLQGEVDAEMRYGLALAEDAQILNGDGSNENLLGLMPQATAYVLPTGASTPATAIDKLRAASLHVPCGAERCGAQTGDAALQMVAVWFLAWQFTSDPLPDAIRKGLNDFAKEHRR